MVNRVEFELSVVAFSGGEGKFEAGQLDEVDVRASGNQVMQTFPACRIRRLLEARRQASGGSSVFEIGWTRG